MIILGWEVYATRWPWQHRAATWANDEGKWGWNPGGLGRFGGGWQWAIGFNASKHFRGIVIDLLFGSIRISKLSRCSVCGGYMTHGQRRGKWDVKSKTNNSHMHLECVPETPEISKVPDMSKAYDMSDVPF